MQSRFQEVVLEDGKKLVFLVDSGNIKGEIGGLTVKLEGAKNIYDEPHLNSLPNSGGISACDIEISSVRIDTYTLGFQWLTVLTFDCVFEFCDLISLSVCNLENMRLIFNEMSTISPNPSNIINSYAISTKQVKGGCLRNHIFGQADSLHDRQPIPLQLLPFERCTITCQYHM